MRRSSASSAILRSAAATTALTGLALLTIGSASAQSALPSVGR